MDTKKSILLLFAILAISVWVLGSVNQGRAETLKYKVYTYAIKQESSPISDVEGHSLGFAVRVHDQTAVADDKVCLSL